MPPRAVRMPRAAIMPSMSSGLVSLRTEDHGLVAGRPFGGFLGGEDDAADGGAGGGGQTGGG